MILRTRKLHVHHESLFLLLESSLQSIPFNVILATLLAFDFYYKNVPLTKIILWFSTILILSIIRWFYSKTVIKQAYHVSKTNYSLIIFITLTFLTGAAWGASYFIFLPHINGIHEAIIILVLGGMSSGAVVSLSPYLPAYYAYVLPMFLPIIIYNFYTQQFDRVILATMFLLFVIMVMVTAKLNSKLLIKIVKLNLQKDNLIKKLSVANKKLEESNIKLEISNAEIKAISITDPLTGLYNRRYFDNIINSEVNRAKRNNFSLNLLMIDVDNFKVINDTFGHPAGDDFLIFFASILKNSIRRANDVVVRLGGDEFAAIMGNLTLEESITVCNLMRFEFANNNQYKEVSLSMGLICVKPNNSDSVQNIISAADKALYLSKENGKNQLVPKII